MRDSAIRGRALLEAYAEDHGLYPDADAAEELFQDVLDFLTDEFDADTAIYVLAAVGAPRDG
jgi:hypothetical protein